MAKKETVSGRAKGGEARAKALTPEERKAIAQKAAAKRWGYKATHKGNFQEEFGIDVECYVLDDVHKTAVISQRGMGAALGFSDGGGGRLPKFLQGVKIAPYLGLELKEKLENPLVFQGLGAVSKRTIYGFDVTILIDLCKAIVTADEDDQLAHNQKHIAKQARIILNASAKAGIKGLVYALSGYRPSEQEVINAFKAYIAEEARKYEPEFPSELYMQWHRLYDIEIPQKGRPWQFKHLTLKHIYIPLAESNGKILELMRAEKAKDGDRKKKLFQFLNEIGARALRMHLGRVLEMCESSADKDSYEAKIVERFGGQHKLDLLTTQVSAT